MEDNRIDPNFVLAYISTLDLLSIAFNVIKTLPGKGNKTLEEAMKRVFSYSIPHIVREMDRYPGFDWQSVLNANPNFAKAAWEAIERNRPDLAEKIKRTTVN